MNKKIALIIAAIFALSATLVIVLKNDNSSENTVVKVETDSEKLTDTTDLNNESIEPSEETDNPETWEEKELPIPTLTKSSGNNGSIPQKVLVNFTCSGVVNADCRIKLTNRDTTDVIKLDKQFLEAPQRGDPSVTWTWSSIAGRWKVTAIVSAYDFAESESKIHDLVVL